MFYSQNSSNNSVFLPREKKYNSFHSDLSATSPMPPSEVRKEIHALVNEDKLRNGYNSSKMSQHSNFSQNRAQTNSQPNYSQNYSDMNRSHNLTVSEFSDNFDFTPSSHSFLDNMKNKQMGGASRFSEMYDENDITGDSMNRNINSISTDSMDNSSNYNRSKRMVMARSNNSQRGDSQRSDSQRSDSQRSDSQRNNSQYSDSQRSNSQYSDSQYSDRMARSTFSDLSNSNNDYDDESEYSSSHSSRKPARELPDSIKKRQNLRTFLSDNGVKGGLEITSLIEKYINESGVDKKKNLDEAIKIAKERMLDDIKKGKIEQIIQKIKDDMKAKREEKKKLKQ